MKILLDTHIWIWYLLGDERLPRNIVSLMTDESNELWLSSISVWETLILGQKGRIEFKTNPITWIESHLQLLNLKEATLTNKIAILSRQLVMAHEDPADRFIVATAIHHNLTLATIDRRLIQLEWLDTVS